MSALRRVALVVTAIALAGCGDERQDIFTPEGDYARKINDLQVPVFWVAAIVGVAVFAGLGFVIVKGVRRHSADEPDPVQLEGNFKLEITWTIAPAILLAVISVFTVATLFELDDAPAGAAELERMEITVYGQQWWWSYEYDLDGDPETPPEIITANDLVIPAGEAIELTIESRDVIHSFWIPSLAGTRDAVPGRSHPLLIQADEPGIYEGQCKEYCGLSHANMHARVVALSMDEFRTWLEQQQQEQPLLEAGDPGFEGQELFRNLLCSQCHQINGVNEVDVDEIPLVAGHAPNLTHFMSRGVFAGGLFPLYEDDGDLDVAALEAWLRNPPALKPMAADEARGMPDLGLSEQDIDRLIDYLETLGPAPPIQSGSAPNDDDSEQD